MILLLQPQLLGFTDMTRNQILDEMLVFRTTLILKFQQKRSVRPTSKEIDLRRDMNLEGLTWGENGKKGHSGSKRVMGRKGENMAVLANLSTVTGSHRSRD